MCIAKDVSGKNVHCKRCAWETMGSGKRCKLQKAACRENMCAGKRFELGRDEKLSSAAVVDKDVLWKRCALQESQSRAAEGRPIVARRFSAGKRYRESSSPGGTTDAAPQTAGVRYSKLRPRVSGNCVAMKLARRKPAPQR
jgi:hypothetical protein